MQIKPIRQISRVLVAMKKDLQLYFLRHGRTKWNEQGLLQGSCDSPLTAAGIASAKAAAQVLQKIPFVAGYSSTQPRAINTLKYLIDQRQIPLFQHPGICEQYFGSWEGQPIRDLTALAEFKQMMEQPEHYQAKSNGGETYQQLLARSLAAIDDIIQPYNNGNIIIVSHGHTLRLLIHVLAGGYWKHHRRDDKSVRLLNASISQVSYQQTNRATPGVFQLVQLNNNQHLIDDRQHSSLTNNN